MEPRPICNNSLKETPEGAEPRVGPVAQPRELSVSLAEGGGGTFDGGRHVNYRGRPLSDMYLALLQRAGVLIERVADSAEPSPSLTA